MNRLLLIDVTAPVTKRCPFVDEIDTGTITLRFGHRAPELHSLAARLRTYRDVPISHEEFTEVVRAATGAISAVSTWATAGMTVEVRG